MTRRTALELIRRQDLNATLVGIGRITGNDRTAMAELLRRAAVEDQHETRRPQ
jgi:hypothetical protein